jgi:hypothetical protein
VVARKPVAEIDDKTLILADQAEKAMTQVRVVYVNRADNSVNLKTRYNAPCNYHLRGHCHGTNPLFLRTRARCSGVCVPDALLAVAPRCRCPSPADRANHAIPT